MNNFRILRTFYAENSNSFLQSNWQEIEQLWKVHPDSRTSFIIIFNYLETISIGIEQEIMDEIFMKEFFKTIFKEYLSKYGTYLDYIRRVQSDRIYRNFTKMALKWNEEG